MAMIRMLAQLELIYPVSKALFAEIYKIAKFTSVANNRHISSPLSFEKRFIYIDNGVCQIARKIGTKLITIRLIDRGSFIAHEAMSAQAGYIQSIGPVEFISIPAVVLDRLAVTDKSTNIILSVLMQRELAEMNLSIITCSIKPTRKRLDYFRANQPIFEDSIPLKYIASYLGMRLETLIRLRKCYT
ncbi:hypothetical protein [Pedobacter sp. KLB.chiD]|uniref:hypothetical protein n=1 Tax=Pedobacter sp. KLB.chiD TaxID=3387402 RepID=UPI00399B9D3C